MFSCPGCKALFSSDTPCDHPYIGASQACWETYQKVLEKEYSNPDYFKVHRITVDAYAASHIGDQSDRRARQSANLHLIALYLYFERECLVKEIKGFLSRATTPKRNWPEVQHIKSPSWLTVGDVVTAESAQVHEQKVLAWGKSVLEGYHNIYNDLQRLYESILSGHKTV
ncbi:MAG: DUF5946 family protein [Alphaproteobacteria bacterium]